ncbi:sulfatase-like hydrolase/transferase [Prosthecobacter sp.]|uniref:sulfatase-like hydrolase/transferase n=1 Tax=Prosthecobacter sp. TaxID=1965333 RepID=UPI002ABC2280|nr:sulfatase-like hydrolase/transferase [Prosthecobacter sp.]MDZ4405367.1 sulfatase-like hydrolase/transferase [Prosthecobacter sp.]
MKFILIRALFLSLFGPGGAASFAATPPPNIVFVLADDYGINGVGCYGSDCFKGKTPNIDALAKSGLRFEQGYSMPTCNPSRCALMTGRYGFRTGNKPSFKTEPSVAKLLKQAGYATGMAGKWRQMADTPGDWGFDEYLTDPEASGYFWETTYTKNGQEVKTEKPIFYPDVCLEFAVDFFQRHREQPFFFYYPTHLIHNPIVRTPDSKADTTDPDALYEDNVAYMDKELGKLVAALDRLGLRERTLIVFAGDNGTAKYGHEKGTIGGRLINGMKASMQEGGSRVPLIANWKGTISENRVLPDLVDFTDLLPTFAELGGAPLPADVIFDGRSFAPQLRGEKGSPSEWVYVEHNTAPEWYVREQGWKLTHQGELFDMSDAPFVEKPVTADGQSEAASAARLRLQAVLAKLDPASGQHVTPAATPKKKKNKKKPKVEPQQAKPPVSP